MADSFLIFFLVIRLRLKGVACQERIVLRNRARPSLWLAGGARFFWAESASDEGFAMKKSYSLVLLLAWVLWARTQGPTADGWTGTAGFQNQEKCMDNMKEKLDIWRQFRDAKFAGNSVTFSENKTTINYYCLPESEDPRRKPAPK